VHWEVEIDVVRDAVDVDAARGDVGGDEDAHGADLEFVERTEPLTLRAVRVQGAGLDPGALELARDAIGAVLGAGEDEDAIERGSRRRWTSSAGLRCFGTS
jgi:hypothetical protein